MPKTAPAAPAECFIVPARQLSGTRDDVLAQIDELILGLTGLRQLVSMHGPKPVEAPARKLRLVRGFVKVLLFLGIGSNALFFPGALGSADLRRGQNTALMGGVWWFGNKEGAG